MNVYSLVTFRTRIPSSFSSLPLQDGSIFTSKHRRKYRCLHRIRMIEWFMKSLNSLRCNWKQTTIIYLCIEHVVLISINISVVTRKWQPNDRSHNKKHRPIITPLILKNSKTLPSSKRVSLRVFTRVLWHFKPSWGITTYCLIHRIECLFTY